MELKLAIGFITYTETSDSLYMSLVVTVNEGE